MKAPPTLKCDECRELVYSLMWVKDYHGNVVSICCNKCVRKLNDLLERLFKLYGGIKGKCSCRGTPHIMNSKHLLMEIARREKAIKHLPGD